MTDVFDLFGLDKSLKIQTKDEFVKEILPKLQEILNKEFPNSPQKRKIVVYHDRISFAAPCCGDSCRNSSKKRGNIILEGQYKNMYKCFNCGRYMSLKAFFKEYGQDLNLNEIDYISKEKNIRPKNSSDNLDYLFDVKQIEDYCPSRDEFKSILGLQECQTTKIEKYLKNRCQTNFIKFLYSSAVDKLFVLNLTPNNKVFGIQVRDFKKNNGPKYKTYNLQNIHKIILKDNITIPKEINDMSMIFNILLIDYSNVVTILEGPMDSFLIKNSIALCGAGKNVSFPFECRYLFDDDKAGRTHSINKLKCGYKVFLWDLLKKKLSLEHRKKWDVNDVVIWCRNNNKRFPRIDDFFSDDELDLVII